MVKEIAVLMICVSLGVGFSNSAEANGKAERTLATSRNIRVHYELAKTTYLVAEPIFLRISVENNGTEVQCYETGQLWSLQLRDEKGGLLKRKGSFYIETRLVQEGSQRPDRPCPDGLEQLYPRETKLASHRNRSADSHADLERQIDRGSGEDNAEYRADQHRAQRKFALSFVR